MYKSNGKYHWGQLLGLILLLCYIKEMPLIIVNPDKISYVSVDGSNLKVSSRKKMQCFELENLQKYFQYIAANLKRLIESLVLYCLMISKVFLDNLNTFLLVFIQ